MVTSANRDMVFKVLTDPAFRKKLETDPAAAVGKKDLTAQQKLEVKKVLTAVDEIHQKVQRLADELLCANGGPCGIAKGDVGIKDKKIRG
jgi:hypothetical protein